MKEINYEKGVLYIAFKKSFVKECLFSAESLKKHNPNIPIALFTDQEISSPYIDIVKVIKAKHTRCKVDYIGDSPFEKTLYLDSDTIVVRDISDVFDVLDRFDVGVTHDYARKRENYCCIDEYKEIPYSFSEVNGGFMAFNNSIASKEFLALWKEKFYKYRKQTSGWDQVSLRISLWQSKVSMVHLPPEYNIRSKEIREKVRNHHDKLGESHLCPRIYHMHYDREVHRNKFKVDTLEELEKKIQEKALEI